MCVTNVIALEREDQEGKWSTYKSGIRFKVTAQSVVVH